MARFTSRLIPHRCNHSGLGRSRNHLTMTSEDVAPQTRYLLFLPYLTMTQPVEFDVARNSESVAQECLEDAGDTEAGVNVDGPDLVYQALSVDRSKQLALDVAGFVESILARWLHFDMKGESPPGCGQGCDDHEWERWSERIRWAYY